MNVVKLTRTPPGIDNILPAWPQGALAVNPKRKVADFLGEFSSAPATHDDVNELGADTFVEYA